MLKCLPFSDHPIALHSFDMDQEQQQSNLIVDSNAATTTAAALDAAAAADFDVSESLFTMHCFINLSVGRERALVKSVIHEKRGMYPEHRMGFDTEIGQHWDSKCREKNTHRNIAPRAECHILMMKKKRRNAAA